MLTREDNELLTRVGPGTVMGDLFRQYWHPVLIPRELEADGAPLRVRLLGEDLIAFRDTDGRVGLLADNCSHRGASLFFGRNEECGLRCVYHGWKFDVNGQCVDMPNEPAESNFKDRIRHQSYPCTERGGLIWAYMGPLNPPPPLPGFESNDLPDSHIRVVKRVQETNWAQALEGQIDQSHVSFLHSYLDPTAQRFVDPNTPPASGNSGPSSRITQIRASDKHPHFEVVNTQYGVVISARRSSGEDLYYHRISQFLMPHHTMTGPYGEDPGRGWQAWVPIDDENTVIIGVTFHPLHPLTERRPRTPNENGYRIRGGVVDMEPEDRAPATSKPFGAWYPLDTLENDFRIDREIQKNLTYSGIPVFWAQDGGTQLTMGPIYDRTKEHLSNTDSGIIAMRQRVLNAAKALRNEGVTPPGVLNPDWYQVRGAAVELPGNVDWFEQTDEYRRVIAGVNQPGV